MKLLTKTSVYFISVAAILFLMNAIIIYACIAMQFESEVDEHLHATKKSILKNLNEGYLPDEIIAKKDDSKSIKEIQKQTQFIDSYFLSKSKEEFEEHDEDEEIITAKTLVFQTKVKDKIYEVKITSSLTEVSEIGESIISVVVICLCLSLLLLFIVNWIISKVIWSPFMDSLEQIKHWRVKNKAILKFKKTTTNEFNLLNHTLTDLTVQIKTDFLNLKEFTENVSHEAQTPLAILSNKLELLLQEKNYTQKQADLLHKSYQAVQRLYKLNKALILLSRIENKQFIETEPINLSTVIKDKIIELEDFIQAKKIVILTDFKDDLVIQINQTLLNVLIDNLFNNAIKYNLDNDGSINIKLTKNFLSFENSSAIEKLDELQLFDRVSKKSTSNSLGIGLSLIKKIVELYNWQINYSYGNNSHKFEIYF